MPAPPVFQKLNLKEAAEILVLNAPRSFESELARLGDVRVRRKLTGAPRVTFALAFVTRQSEVDALAAPIARAADGDAVVWFAYPKGTSKKYTCEINRDTGWHALGAAGFEGVRMVAIDEDWTAVRFRRTEYIKTMTRDATHAMSRRGKEKTSGRFTTGC